MIYVRYSIYGELYIVMVIIIGEILIVIYRIEENVDFVIVV